MLMWLYCTLVTASNLFHVTCEGLGMYNVHLYVGQSVPALWSIIIDDVLRASACTSFTRDSQ